MKTTLSTKRTTKSQARSTRWNTASHARVASAASMLQQANIAGWQWRWQWRRLWTRLWTGARQVGARWFWKS